MKTKLLLYQKSFMFIEQQATIDKFKRKNCENTSTGILLKKFNLIYIEKKMIFCAFKGSHKMVVPVKSWHLKFSFLSFPKCAMFAKFSKKKSCFIIFIDV